MSYNKLAHLNPFKNLPYLERIYCHTNKIKYISGDIFKGSNNINMLDFGNNKIKWIEENSFEGLTCLEMLDLSVNRIQMLEDKVFDDLKNLK